MSLLNLLGISDAFASASTTATSAAPQHAAGSIWSMLPMLIIFVLVFYFLLIRPQSKRAKEHRKLIESIAKGDEVITSGGIAGKIANIENDYVTLTIAPNVDITIQRASIGLVLPKGTLKSL